MDNYSPPHGRNYQRNAPRIPNQPTDLSVGSNPTNTTQINSTTRMKNLLILIVSFSFLACNSQKITVSQDSTGQWLTIKGNKNGKNIVFISGDEEYRSEEALPQFAKILSKRHGFN